MTFDFNNARTAVKGYEEYANSIKIPEVTNLDESASIQSVTDTETVMRLYGRIFPYDGYINAEEVAELMADVATPNLRVRIHSEGGSLGEAMAIINLLRQYPGRLTTQVDGLALSAGAMIFMAGADRLMPKNMGVAMVHLTQLFPFIGGNRHELMESTERMFKIMEMMDSQLVDMADGVMNLERDAVEEAFAETTFYSPQEAVDVGMATALYEASGDSSETEPEMTNSLRGKLVNMAGERITNLLPKAVPEIPGADQFRGMAGAIFKETMHV